MGQVMRAGGWSEQHPSRLHPCCRWACWAVKDTPWSQLTSRPRSPCPSLPCPARSVYLLPPSIGCGWVGLGYVGCDGSFRCRVWISGDFWTTPQACLPVSV